MAQLEAYSKAYWEYGREAYGEKYDKDVAEFDKRKLRRVGDGRKGVLVKEAAVADSFGAIPATSITRNWNTKYSESGDRLLLFVSGSCGVGSNHALKGFAADPPVPDLAFDRYFRSRSEGELGRRADRVMNQLL